MLILIVGLVIFFAIHLVPANPELRNGLADRFGENAWKGIFSIISLVGFVLIVYGYHKLQLMPGKNPQLWVPPLWTRHVAWLLMLPSLVLLAAAYIPSRVRDVVQHPMLTAVKLWALAHLLANGDLGALLLFGSFLAYAVFDRISVKTRDSRGPLGAKTGGLGGDIAVVVVGIALYAFMLHYGHQLLIGVPVL